LLERCEDVVGGRSRRMTSYYPFATSQRWTSDSVTAVGRQSGFFVPAPWHRCGERCCDTIELQLAGGRRWSWLWRTRVVLCQQPV